MSAITLIEIVIGILVLIGIIGVLVNLSDIARYLRIRSM